MKAPSPGPPDHPLCWSSVICELSSLGFSWWKPGASSELRRPSWGHTGRVLQLWLSGFIVSFHLVNSSGNRSTSHKPANPAMVFLVTQSSPQARAISQHFFEVGRGGCLMLYSAVIMGSQGRNPRQNLKQQPWGSLFIGLLLSQFSARILQSVFWQINMNSFKVSLPARPGGPCLEILAIKWLR